VKSAATLLAAGIVAAVGATAGLVADLQRDAEPPAPPLERVVRPRRFALEIAGRRIVVTVGTPPAPSPSPTPTPTPRRNLLPPEP